MGELHLEIYVERMKREYNVDCSTGKPRVNFRETVTQRSSFNHVHKKQTGGAGQYAKIIGFIEPMQPDPESGKDVEFENLVMGGNIPSGFIPAVEKVKFRLGFLMVLEHSHSLARAFWKLWRRELSLETLSLAADLF
jgi:translation elongation factor EF-G